MSGWFVFYFEFYENLFNKFKKSGKLYEPLYIFI